MKNLMLVLSVIFTLLTSCNQKDNQPVLFPEELITEMKNVSSIAYDAEFKMRYIGNLDTNIIKSKCTLIRIPSDTLFGGMIWIDATDTTSLYYDLNYIYEINSKQETITKYDPYNEQKWAIAGSIYDNIIDYDFLNNYNTFSKIIQDTNIKKNFNDTLYGNSAFRNVVFNYEDSEEIKNYNNNYFINKDLKIIQKNVRTLYYMDELQYSSLEKTNIRRNAFTPKIMELEFRKYKDFKISDYIEPEREPLLDTNTIAPDFSGIFYPDSSKFELNNFHGKIVLLDFFYMSCYYCIQAIPHLSKLYDKYKDKDVVVLGINPFDNNENSLRRLPKFIENNKMTYPIIFVDTEISKLYNVSGYPTMYIIDKEGTIKYRSPVWGEGLEELFEFEFKKLLE
jgi:peroxiredoxin